MKVRIIVDSTADLCRQDKAKFPVVPMTVSFGEEEYVDGVTIDHKAFYEKLTTCQELPRTSQATPDRFAEEFRKVSEAGESAVVITLAANLSGTYQSAMIAASDFENIYVVESGSVAIGIGILAMRALELAAGGMEAKTLAETLETEKKQICLVAVLDTLEYLKRGGRISKTVAFAGGLLNIKPVLKIQDGEVNIVGKARGSKQGNAMLNDLIAQAGGVDFDRPYLLGYSGLSDELLKKYMADSQDVWQTEEPPYAVIGSIIGTHAGPGTVAAACFVKP